MSYGNGFGQIDYSGSAPGERLGIDSSRILYTADNRVWNTSARWAQRGINAWRAANPGHGPQIYVDGRAGPVTIAALNAASPGAAAENYPVGTRVTDRILLNRAFADRLAALAPVRDPARPAATTTARTTSTSTSTSASPDAAKAGSAVVPASGAAVVVDEGTSGGLPSWLVPALVVGGVVLVGSAVIIGMSRRKKVAANRRTSKNARRRTRVLDPALDPALPHGYTVWKQSNDYLYGWNWKNTDGDRGTGYRTQRAARLAAVRFDDLRTFARREYEPVRRNGPEIARTILQQLGGTGRLSAMIGAKNFVDIGDGVQFGFKGVRGIGNKVVIKLEPSDTYTVEFWWVRAGKAEKLAFYEEIYAEGLAPLFQRETGLRLSMNASGEKWVVTRAKMGSVFDDQIVSTHRDRESAMKKVEKLNLASARAVRVDSGGTHEIVELPWGTTTRPRMKRNAGRRRRAA